MKLERHGASSMLSTVYSSLNTDRAETILLTALFSVLAIVGLFANVYDSLAADILPNPDLPQNSSVF